MLGSLGLLLRPCFRQLCHQLPHLPVADSLCLLSCGVLHIHLPDESMPISLREAEKAKRRVLSDRMGQGLPQEYIESKQVCQQTTGRVYCVWPSSLPNAASVSAKETLVQWRSVMVSKAPTLRLKWWNSIASRRPSHSAAAAHAPNGGPA